MIAERLDAALERRLWPQSRLGAKQLCYKLGISDDTLRRWRMGETRTPAESLIAMVAFFRSRGDDAFAAEVLAARMQWWVTAKGEVLRCDDLDAAARSRQGLAGVAGDASAAARRNLGWASVSLADGLAEVEYHEKGLSAGSVRGLRQMLPAAAAVRRIVAVDAERHRLAPELPADAMRALDLALAFARLAPAGAWRVDRLSLDGLGHPSARRLASLAATSGDLLASAAAAGMLAECSIFRAEGENVISLQLGSSIPWPAAFKLELANRNVMARADLRYAELIRTHVLEAREGPTYYRLKGTVNGWPVDYRRPIFPAGNGLFLTHTDKVA